MSELIKSESEGSVAVRQAIAGVEDLYICDNQSLEDLLFNRRHAPLQFTSLCREASVQFLRHLEPFMTGRLDAVAELQFLSKGYYYWLHNAFERAYSANLPINFAATSRVAVNDGLVRVKVHYSNYDAAAETLIIGDTVASGETICTGLADYLERYTAKNIVVLSYAGSATGARRIQAFCDERGLKVIFLYGLAAFGLAHNGFDLAFLNNETITNAKYLDRAQRAFSGRGISVAGWDFGSQAQAPRKYAALSRVEANYWDMADSAVFVPRGGKIDELLIEKERSAFAGRILDVKTIK